MLHIKDCLELINYNILFCEDFHWKCYGDNIKIINAVSITGTIIFMYSVDTKEVIEIQAWDDIENYQYRWIHPGYIESYIEESTDRNVNYKLSVDDNKFIDIEIIDDILEKVSEIYNNKVYDTRVSIPLDFSEEELFQVMKLAHESDVTLNQYIEKILLTVINKENK
jgi:hypothetical protein